MPHLLGIRNHLDLSMAGSMEALKHTGAAVIPTTTLAGGVWKYVNRKWLVFIRIQIVVDDLLYTVFHTPYRGTTGDKDGQLLGEPLTLA